MKELSTKEKAKCYDEAIKRAKGAHNSAKSDKENGVTDKITEHTIQLTETIFPELKESEGERVRKQIISFLKEFEYDHYRCLDFSSWIAWLEKQGEQKYADKVEPKSSWKPTEKQINAIRLARSFVTDDSSDNPTLSEILTELEEQLRNLI